VQFDDPPAVDRPQEAGVGRSAQRRRQAPFWFANSRCDIDCNRTPYKLAARLQDTMTHCTVLVNGGRVARWGACGRICRSLEW
jgi:hypothetical protein